MKILWITNIVFPEALSQITGQTLLKSSGGWLLGAAYNLLEMDPSINLAVASVCDRVSSLTEVTGEQIRYYLIPKGKGNEQYNSEYDKYWKQIKADFNPNIVHIHGTECSHGLSYINSCSNENVVISIQGLTTFCSKYYTCGLTWKEIYKNLTFHDLLRGSIYFQKKYFAKRSRYEQDMIRKTNYIIGRTNWDRVHSTLINPNVRYFHCDEVLRDEFYSGEKWNYSSCKKHTIFLSQASYPLKGLHQLLKALDIVYSYYPDTVVRIAGKDITDRSSLGGRLRYTGYAKIITSKIKDKVWRDRIVFTGNLSADEMKQEYLNSNLFICPSTIENSSNSLGEAQILGVPVVSSYVGGIPDMMKGNELNMYRFEEFEMLADIICRVFANKENQEDMSIVATERHDRRKNSLTLLSIYSNILKNDIK